MKKTNLLAAAFAATMISGGAFAQQFHVKENFGFFGSVSKDVTGTSTDGTQEKLMFGGLGGGVPLGISVTYMVNDNIGVDLGFSYLFGSRTTMSEVTASGAEGSVVSRTRQARLSPSFVMSTGNGAEELAVYSKIGFVLPVAGKTITDVSYDNFGGSGDKLTQTIESKGKISLGFTFAVGAMYPLSDNFSLFGELQYVGLSIRPSQSTYTEYSIGSTNVLNTLSDDQKTTKYVNKTESDGTMKAGEALSPGATGFNALGFNLGLAINF